MTETAQTRFAAWTRREIAPLLRSEGFRGSGTTFTQRVGPDWLIVHLEKSRHSDPVLVLFRVSVGVVSAAVRASRGEDPDAAPSPRRLDRMYGSRSLYDPPGGDGWFRLSAADPDEVAADLANRLRSLLRDAIEEAAGRTGDGALLDLRLTMVGPLENASPAEINDLVALARSVGDHELVVRIAAAQDRPRVPDPSRDAERRGGLEVGLAIAEEMGGSISLRGETVTADNIDRLAMWEPPEFLLPTDVPRPPNRRRINRALADLISTRVVRRRHAAWELGAAPRSREILEALRAAARTDADLSVRQAAIQTLGLLADADPSTWQMAIEALEGETGNEDSGALQTAYGTVALAQLDPRRRRERTRLAVERLLEIDLAWRRSYRVLLDRLAKEA